MKKWKNSVDVRRFKYQLEKAVDTLEYEAGIYGYHQEPEYLRVIENLKKEIKDLEEQLQGKLW